MMRNDEEIVSRRGFLKSTLAAALGFGTLGLETSWAQRKPNPRPRLPRKPPLTPGNFNLFLARLSCDPGRVHQYVALAQKDLYGFLSARFTLLPQQKAFFKTVYPKEKAKINTIIAAALRFVQAQGRGAVLQVAYGRRGRSGKNPRGYCLPRGKACLYYYIKHIPR